MNRDAVTALPGEEIRGRAQGPEAGAGPRRRRRGWTSTPIKARTHIHFGIVIIVGFNQRDLGIKQFKKAIEIQADIGLTKSLVTPELTAAFNEAKKAAATTADPGDAARHAAADARDAAAGDAERADVPASGLVHEAVAEGKQGSAISVTVGVQNDLEFEKIILAYRPEGATEFLGREMKEVADGRYGAEIPTSATSGGTVAYYIEAEDAEGAPIAARGSVDNPLVIHLLGVGVSHRTGDDDGRGRRRGRRGPGPSLLRRQLMRAPASAGRAASATRTPTSRSIRRGWRCPGCRQIAPEFGYWLSSSLMLSLQIRYEYITGTTDIYETTQTMCPNKVCHTANYAFAAFAKATGSSVPEKFHPFFSLAAGGGRIRHVVSFQSNRSAQNCGPGHNETASTRSARDRCCSVRAAASCTTSRAPLGGAAGELRARVPGFQRPHRRQSRRRFRF